MAKRYVTYFGYFGPTSNVKDAPAALTGDVVARLLGVAAKTPVKLATLDGDEVVK